MVQIRSTQLIKMRKPLFVVVLLKTSPIAPPKTVAPPTVKAVSISKFIINSAS